MKARNCFVSEMFSAAFPFSHLVYLCFYQLAVADRFRTRRARMGLQHGAHPHLVALWTDGMHHKLKYIHYIVWYIRSFWRMVSLARLGITSICYYVIYSQYCSQKIGFSSLNFSIETKRPAMPHKRAKRSVREQQRKGRLAYPASGS